MRKQIHLSQAVGRTIEAVAIPRNTFMDERVLIALSGDTFAQIYIAQDGDEPELETSLEGGFDHRDYDDESLSKIFDEDTLATWEQESKASNAEAEAAQERIDRREYDRLKKRFEPEAK